jgi:hypothetical protein
LFRKAASSFGNKDRACDIIAQIFQFQPIEAGLKDDILVYL